MGLKGIMALFLLVVLSLSSYIVGGGRSLSKEEDMEWGRQLKLKSTVKTIQSTNVDTFDCVDINSQPAFDHPLLKNHKIQINPSFSSKWMKNQDSSIGKLFELELQSEGCPSGKVPIQKTNGEELTNAKLLSKAYLGNTHPLTDAYPGKHFATLDTKNSLANTTYYGARAIINLQNPHVEMNQISAAQIWVENGPSTDVNSIQVGWAVHPRLYGDNHTRLTTYWTADGYGKTGCYNAMCSGFVQVDPSLFVGAAYNHTTIPSGQEFTTDIMVAQDQTTGNWWLIVENTTKVGYWPKQIFTHLATGASSIRYGGMTYISPDAYSPPMGSGHFPNMTSEHVCFFAEISIVNAENKLVDIDGSKMNVFVDNNNCYGLKYLDTHDEDLRQFLTFGGPGGASCGT